MPAQPPPDPTVDTALAAARSYAPTLAATSLTDRAALLHQLADLLEEHQTAIVDLADQETSLGRPRLSSDLQRTRDQLDLFADVVTDGAYLEAMIDRPATDRAQPPPDVRRMLQPLGPVAVFSASNFPLAFSVLGGDTASALAAGCPVIVKAHEGHPRLSTVIGDLAAGVLPAGALSVVHGRPAGTALVTHPDITAVGFTGSTAGGRVLLDLAGARPDPIPFYGELGSVNPVVVTPAAAAARGGRIAAEFVASYTLGQGQFCTKPGLLFLPAGHGLGPALAEHTERVPAAAMLGAWILEGFQRSVDTLTELPGVRPIASGRAVAGDAATPTLLAMTAEAFRAAPAAADECFGPAAIVVEYHDEADLLVALQAVPPSLTLTVHGQDGTDDVLARTLLTGARAGRLIWNGWPTGVSVTWAMHHGGPWPASTAALHTSVGATAIRRWLRPVAYQNAPDTLLPPALQDANPWRIPRQERTR